MMKNKKLSKTLKRIILGTKILAISSLSFLVIASPSFAKTQGHYVSLNAVGSSYKAKYKSALEISDTNLVERSSLGLGLGYKYAFNINGFFIAPGIFAEINNVEENNYDNSIQERLRVNDRYGFKADVGYDILNNFAFYLTGGIANIDYEYRYVTNTADFYYNFSDQSIGYFYGAGLIFKVSESLGIDLEYNTQSLDSKVPAGPFILGGDRILSDLQVIKLGISYNF